MIKFYYQSVALLFKIIKQKYFFIELTKTDHLT